VLICWPSEFTRYGLHANTNLAGGDWILIPGVTDRQFELPLIPQKLFRVESPP